MTKVAIVGAGCAGLGAAAKLLELGKGQIDVYLIDALDRLGGRAWTDTQHGFPFDRGPQYIQDPDINPWTNIADKLGFKLIQPNTVGFYRFFEKGQWENKISIEGVSKVIAALEGTEAIARAAYEKSDPSNINIPMMIEPGQIDADTRLASGSFSAGAIGESAEPWQYVARDAARQDSPDEAGDNKFVEKGLGTLVAAYGKHLIDSSGNINCRQSTVVTAVRWNIPQNNISIFSSDSLLYDVDYCIITVSCVALSRISFVPPLDREHARANSFISLGSYKKIAFKPNPPIDERIAEKRDYYIYDSVNDGCWLYFRLPTAPEALIGVAAGNFASRLDRLDDKTAAQAFVDILNKAYPPLEPPRPSLVPSHEPLVTNWSQQPHFWGAYSYTRYDGGDHDDPTAFEARVNIAKPHLDGRIRFAGEATWTQAYATIHGAYLSGVREATAILREVGLA